MPRSLRTELLPGENRIVSTPLLLPCPSNRSFLAGAIRNISASKRKLSLLHSTTCAHRAANRSDHSSSHRFNPREDSSFNPRSVYTRCGTRSIQAARFPSKPALGVLKSVIAGLRRRKTNSNFRKDRRSEMSAIPRSICTATASTPSASARCSSSSPGEEISVTSNPASRSALRRPDSTRQVCALVTPTTSPGRAPARISARGIGREAARAPGNAGVNSSACGLWSTEGVILQKPY